jgi:hypothetical protein
MKYLRSALIDIIIMTGLFLICVLIQKSNGSIIRTVGIPMSGVAAYILLKAVWKIYNEKKNNHLK